MNMNSCQEDDIRMEAISALLDGEQPAPVDEALGLDCPEWTARRRQYEQISQWLQELPDPEPTPGFVERAMDCIEARRPPSSWAHSQRMWGAAVAAAAVLLAFLAAYWQLAAPKARNAGPDLARSLVYETDAIQAPLETEEDLFEADALLWPVLDEMPEGAALGEVLAQFEQLPAEQLTWLLAEMALNEAARAADEQELYDTNAIATPAWCWENEDAVSDAFEWIETLDSVEINAFNQMLRTTLSEA